MVIYPIFMHIPVHAMHAAKYVYICNTVYKGGGKLGVDPIGYKHKM